MISQCKGKDLSKVPASRLKPGIYYGSIKYDGHYGQIHKLRDRVEFYTSGGKPFKLPKLEQELLDAFGDLEFVLEFEYNMQGKGKLGARTSNGKLTTYRVNTEKGISNASLEGNEVFRIFDIILYGKFILNTSFVQRLELLSSLAKKFPPRLELIEYKASSLENFQAEAKELVKFGFEGMYLKHCDHRYLPGKRVNDAIKLKYRPTADLKCIQVEPGEGKYLGMIGSLVLQDSKGRRVKVGSGLDDLDRARDPKDFIDKVVEFEYEQILDTYIQPTYVRIREDKTIEEID